VFTFFKRKPRPEPNLRIVQWDGVSVAVTCIHCRVCNEHFFLSDDSVVRMQFCPYCGVRYEGTTPVANEDMFPRLKKLLPGWRKKNERNRPDQERTRAAD
jgi:hypothetical protein